MIFNSTPTGGGMTLLWENENPKIGFSEQTIPCKTSGYKAFLLVMKAERMYEHYYAKIIGNIQEVNMCVDGLTGLHPNNRYYRIAKVTESGIWFEDMGTEQPNYSNGSNVSSQSSNYAFPYKVYGIL